jgi:hypothetical protein
MKKLKVNCIKVMNLTILLLMICLLISCAAKAKQIYLPSGDIGFNVDCSDTEDTTFLGITMSWGKCYEKASDLCGARGYDIVEKTVDGQVIENNIEVNIGNRSRYTRRTMLITCK